MNKGDMGSPSPLMGIMPPLLIVIGLHIGVTSVVADDAIGRLVKAFSVPAAPVKYESPQFVVFTDLSEVEAQLAIGRMETTLCFAVDHWKRPHRGKIECYIVGDLANWPSESLPHPLARILIAGVGGATMSDKKGVAPTIRSQAVIYASGAPGIAEHEVIHAYCAQNFGGTGPDWYKEGMAEMAVFGERSGMGVRCPTERLKLLRGETVRQVSEVLGRGHSTSNLLRSLDAMQATKRRVLLEAWTAQDSENVARAREDYVWSWALCHLLCHNQNFATRFRTLGGEYLTNKTTSFGQFFAPMQSEIMFEFALFLEHVDAGYRVDLCVWDWQKHFHSLSDCPEVTSRCAAARGWQPSGLLVTAGTSYAYRAEGEWGVSAGSVKSNGDGLANGAGRLKGIVLQDYKLGAPFAMGNEGTFVAPMSGKLYLRCHDHWNELEDNQGDISVRLSLPRTHAR